MAPSVPISLPRASLEVVSMVNESPPLARQPGRGSARDACALPGDSQVAAAQTSSDTASAATERTSAGGAASSSAAAVALPAVVDIGNAETAAIGGRAESGGESGAALSAASNSGSTAGAVSAADTYVGGQNSIPRKRSLVSAAVQVPFLSAQPLCDVMLPKLTSLDPLPCPAEH